MKDKKEIKILVLSCIACLLPCLAGIYFYPRLPDELATHFDLQNIPNGYSSKPFALFGIPVILMFLNLVVWGSCQMDKKVSTNASVVIKNIVKWLVPVISVLMQTITILYGLGKKIDVGQICMLLMGMLILVMGNYFPKCKTNYTIGLRFPWTLADEEVWNRTHRMAGKVWVTGGILLLILPFFHLFRLGMAVLIIILVIPGIYSYIIAKKKQEKG